MADLSIMKLAGTTGRLLNSLASTGLVEYQFQSGAKFWRRTEAGEEALSTRASKAKKARKR